MNPDGQFADGRGESLEENSSHTDLRQQTDRYPQNRAHHGPHPRLHRGGRLTISVGTYGGSSMSCLKLIQRRLKYFQSSTLKVLSHRQQILVSRNYR